MIKFLYDGNKIWYMDSKPYSQKEKGRRKITNKVNI